MLEVGSGLPGFLRAMPRSRGGKRHEVIANHVTVLGVGSCQLQSHSLNILQVDNYTFKRKPYSTIKYIVYEYQDIDMHET